MLLMDMVMWTLLLLLPTDVDGGSWIVVASGMTTPSAIGE